MATMKLVPSAYYLSNTQYLRIADAANMYDDCDSTTHGTITHNRASSSSTYYAYLRGFDFDSIPEQAEVTGFTIRIKASATGHTTSTSSSYMMSLANGTSQIGSTYADGRLSTTVDTFAFSEGSLTWETIKNYGSNFGIRIPLRRASSSTADVVSVYGAEIEVEYTMPNPRTLSVSSSGDGTVTPSGTSTVYDGDEVEIVITPTNKSDAVTATKNGVDITDDLVAHGAGSTVTVAPEAATTSGIQSGSSYADDAVGHTAESPASTTSNMYASRGSTGYAEYSFDFSDIPSNAVIEDIEVRCHGHRESSTISSTYVSKCALYLNGSEASEEVDFPSTSASIITLKPDTMPTRAQLDNMTVRHFVGYYGGLVTGISFEITYSTGTGLDHYTYTFTVSADAAIAVTIGSSGGGSQFYIKETASQWDQYSKLWKKTASGWTEVDPYDELDTTKQYRIIEV